MKVWAPPAFAQRLPVVWAVPVVQVKPVPGETMSFVSEIEVPLVLAMTEAVESVSVPVPRARELLMLSVPEVLTPPLKELEPESVETPDAVSWKLPADEMLPVKTPATVLLAVSDMLPPNVPVLSVLAVTRVSRMPPARTTGPRSDASPAMSVPDWIVVVPV